ncbi:hypothetical protein LINGRAHAP2_LOCUS10187, partial [Linum grandiflorum]
RQDVILSVTLKDPNEVGEGFETKYVLWLDIVSDGTHADEHSRNSDTDEVQQQIPSVKRVRKPGRDTASHPTAAPI